MIDPNDSMVDALLVERAGYLSHGLKARAALVDEQLKLRGYSDPKPDKEPVEPEPADAADPAADEASVDDQPEPVEPKRTTVESKPRRRA